MKYSMELWSSLHIAHCLGDMGAILGGFELGSVEELESLFYWLFTARLCFDVLGMTSGLSPLLLPPSTHSRTRSSGLGLGRGPQRVCAGFILKLLKPSWLQAVDLFNERPIFVPGLTLVESLPAHLWLLSKWIRCLLLLGDLCLFLNLASVFPISVATDEVD